jgi:hypothetical protein
MRLRNLPAVLVLIAVVTGGVALGMRFSGPLTTFAATATPVKEPGHRSCVRLMRRQHHTRGDARGWCRDGRGQAWLHARITNTGRAESTAICNASAYDGTGRRLFSRDVPTAALGSYPFGPSFRPGRTVALTTPIAHAYAPVASYRVECKAPTGASS